MTIDHDGPTPVYIQLADILRAQIAAGKYKTRRQLPTEKVLMEEYGLGRDSVRAAIKVLRDEGLVQTVHPKGTFVIPEADRNQSQSNEGGLP